MKKLVLFLAMFLALQLTAIASNPTPIEVTVPGGGFETGLTGWSDWSNDSKFCIDTTANAHSGTHSLRMIAMPSNNAGAGRAYGFPVAGSSFKEGDIFIGKVWAMWDDGVDTTLIVPGSVTFGVEYKFPLNYDPETELPTDPSSSNYGRQIHWDYTVDVNRAGGYHQYVVDENNIIPLPKNVESIYIDVYSWLSINKRLYFDDFQLFRIPATGTGINTINDNSKVKLYPNPFKGDILYIETPASASKIVSILDLAGKEILTKSLHGNTMNVSSLSKGSYIVKVSSSEFSASKLLIVK